MPNEKGMFNQDETDEQYSFSYPLARWIGKFLPKSEQVIDFGCGRGSYLAYLQDMGFEKLIGVEGVRQHSEVPHELIKTQDLTESFDLGVKGNVICLEVGEHIPADKWLTLIENIKTHLKDDGKLIYSHAIINQGGLGHINCRHNFEIIDRLYYCGFKLMVEKSLEARNVIEDNHCGWFKQTIMIFEKIK